MVVETEALERHYVGNDFITASDIIVAMSTALDLTEGQPAGHAARSCWIGMHLAEHIGLESEYNPPYFTRCFSRTLAVQAMHRKRAIYLARTIARLSESLRP